MKRRKNILTKMAAMVCAVLCIVMVGVQVYAIAPQENPDTAKVEFSGLSLFQFYASTLDSVLTKNQQEIQTNIEKSPFRQHPYGFAGFF